MKPDLRKALASTIRTAIESSGFDVYGVRVGNDRSLHVLADRMEGRISVSDIRRITFLIRDVMAELGHDVDAWLTEVESPGADRVLSSERHFARFRGERIKVRLKDHNAQPRTLSGSIVEVVDGRLSMTVEGASARVIPFTEIDEVRLDPRLPF